MADKYVSTTGSDAASGSLAAPWLTLAYGFSHISSNDTLWIRGGTYAGDLDGCTLPSGSNDGTRTIVRAYTGETPVINGYNGGIGFANSGATRAYITFIGITLDGVNMLTFVLAAGFYVSYNSSYITIQDSIVKNYPNCPGGINFNNSSNGNSDNCRVINCTVFNNGNMTAGGGTDQQHGIYAAGTNQLFEGNNIYGNAGYGLHIFAGAANKSDGTVVRKNRIHGNCFNPNWGSGELLAQDGDAILVYNNLIYRDGGGLGTSYGLAGIGDGANIQFLNNSLYSNGSDSGFAVKSNCTTAKVRNNIVFNTADGIVDLGTGTTLSNNKTTDPSFVNAAGGNFYLNSGSNCIDAGFDTSAILTDDFVGTARPQHVVYDIGAYEYIFPPDPPPSPGSVIIGIVGGL